MQHNTKELKLKNTNSRKKKVIPDAPEGLIFPVSLMEPVVKS